METMPNSIDYTTKLTQPHQVTSPSSKPQPPEGTISTNQTGKLILRPSEILDHSSHQSNNQLTRDESDQGPADHPLQLASTVTKTNNTPPAAGDATATASRSRYIYRECQKNHAASMGSYVVDGCREFMPSGEEETVKALKCAACECHRSFHKRDIEDADNSQQLIFLANHQYTYHQYPTGNEINTGTRRGRNHYFQPSTTPPHHHRDSHRRPVMTASGRPTDSSSEDLNMFRVNVRGRQKTMTITDEAPSSKKRFRTKFSKEQKVRMQLVAEELGWKIQKKEDEEQVEQLCDELGVKRRVFKVWMHNNKQKKQHNKVDR